MKTIACSIAKRVWLCGALMSSSALWAGYDEDLAALNYVELTVFPVTLSSVFNPPFLPSNQNFWPMEPFQNNPHYRHVEGPNKWYIHNAVENPVSSVYAPATGIVRVEDLGTRSTLVSVNGKDYYLDTTVAVHHSPTIWTHYGHIALSKNLADRVLASASSYVRVEAGEEIGAQYFGPSETIRHGLDFRVVDDSLYNDIVLDPENGMNTAVNPLDAFSASMKTQILQAHAPFSDAVKATGLYPSYLLEDSRINFNVPATFWGLWFKDDQDYPLDMNGGEDWSIIKFIRMDFLSDDTFWKFKQDHSDVAGLMASRPNTGSNPQGTVPYSKAFREDGYLIRESGDDHTGIMRHVYFSPFEQVYVYYRYEVVDNGASKYDDTLKLQGFDTLVEAQAGFTSGVAVFRRSDVRLSMVQGTIRNGLGQGVAGAHVVLETPSHALLATTDSSGNYSMLVPSGRNRSLIITHSSYQPKTLPSLTFPAEQTLTQNTMLSDLNLTVPTLSGAALGPTSIRWSWTAATGANGYRVVSAADANVSGDLSAGTLTWDETGLTPNTVYERHVVAFNASDSLGSSSLSRRTNATSATALVVSAITATTASLQWSANSNPAGTTFRISYGPTGGSVSTVDTTNNSITLSSLSPLTDMTASVRAVDGDGGQSDSGSTPSTSFFTLASVATQLAVESRTTSTVDVGWFANGNPDGTTYKATLSATGQSDVVIEGTARTASFTSLTPNTAYRVRVQSQNNDLSFSSEEASPALTVYSKSNPPMLLVVSETGARSLKLQWDANANPAGTTYRIVATNARQTKRSAIVATTEARVENLIGDTNYSLLVETIGLDGDAVESATSVSATTEKPAPVTRTLDPAAGDTIDHEGKSGAIRLQIPPNTFHSATDIEVKIPDSVPSDASAGNRLAGLGVALEVDIADRSQPSNEVKIKVCYDDSEVAGRNEQQLVLARWNPTINLWMPLPSTADADNNCVTGRTNHFSLFQLMQAAPVTDLSLAKAYPNPFQPYLNQASVHFENLSSAATVRLYTITGALVRELTADAAGSVEWNGTNAFGEAVASGVYFAYIDGNGMHKTLKLAVQR